MAGVLGFEPRNGGTKNRCLTTWLYPNSAGTMELHYQILKKNPIKYCNNSPSSFLKDLLGTKIHPCLFAWLIPKKMPNKAQFCLYACVRGPPGLAKSPEIQSAVPTPPPPRQCFPVLIQKAKSQKQFTYLIK